MLHGFQRSSELFFCLLGPLLDTPMLSKGLLGILHLILEIPDMRMTL